MPKCCSVVVVEVGTQMASFMSLKASPEKRIHCVIVVIFTIKATEAATKSLES